jgi:hypothetical protein
VVPFLLNEPNEERLPAPEKFYVHRNEVRGFDLDHSVILHARDNRLNDGSKPNQAALAVTKPELPYDWRGPILVMSYNSRKIDGG